MKKLLFTILLSISAIAPVSPCGQSDNIRKAFRIVESALRHSRRRSLSYGGHAEREFICPFEAEHALQVYYKEFRSACEDCKAIAIFEYQPFILKLERILEDCQR